MTFRNAIAMLVLLVSTATASFAQSQNVKVQKGPDGWRLLVNGTPTMINGMNWDYFPIGTNFNYSLWNQSDEFIKNALDDEMALLKNMNVNVIRVYTGIPKKWITYIYDTYGIYTMLNHSFGRYGLTVNGSWVPNTEYADKDVRELLLKETKELANQYRDTRGLLLYLLGNENNYGLFWAGAETEDFPDEEERINFIGETRGRPMYRLMNDAAKMMKSIDSNHPVALCNGDLLFLEIIAEEAKDIDIYGTNVYRGISFGDLFERVDKEYGKPVLFTEFGADAFNARTNKEDQMSQAKFDLGNWYEIYLNAAGMGKTGNSIGGFTFQFSDGWWKTGQTEELDIHNAQASWANGGYTFDFVEGQNNMNEEWFGIAAKGATDANGYYTLFPRAAYYALKDFHAYNVYGGGANEADLMEHMKSISIIEAMIRARSDAPTGSVEKLKINRFTANLSTFSTGGELITTPEVADPMSDDLPNQTGFDHMQSYFIGVEGNPAPNMRATIDLNILGNVAQNPIDELFYESRGGPVQLQSTDQVITAQSLDRLAVYNATFQWDMDYAKVDGFFRTGHYHWAYEGDFFNLYPEANYGPNIDIYNGNAPLGVEIEGKKSFNGLKVAFGPELWWGANPAILVKYRKHLFGGDITGVFHEDLQQIGATASSFAIPQPKTRRATLHIDKKIGPLGVELGGIWAGQPLNGRAFMIARENEDGTYNTYQDEIKPEDNWGGKVKLSFSKGLLNWYASSAVQGLVANGGYDQTLTYTGWKLKDTGSGNQYNVLTGFTYTIGNLQIAPNFLWQKPIEGPVPVDAINGRPRNILDDPFVVRANREQTAGEILFTWDPTPASFFYNWDTDRTEDAEFAMSLGFVYRHLPTVQDAAIGILPDGRTFFPFPGSAPARDLWEVNGKIISKMSRDFGYIANLYVGDAQARGDSDRTIRRFGGTLKMIYKKLTLESFMKFNDWGPFDYHRDFNLTFPFQVMADLNTSLSAVDWVGEFPTTRIGVRATYRTLDDFSPRYAPTYSLNAAGEFEPDPEAVGFANGNEWEFRTYIQININN